MVKVLLDLSAVGGFVAGFSVITGGLSNGVGAGGFGVLTAGCAGAAATAFGNGVGAGAFV